MFLTAVAGVLAVVWLGNAVLTVWLREAASAETLGALLSMGLVVYAVWHLANAAFFRPEFPFDWPPTERDVLAMLPLDPRDLVAYQIASITVTTALKTGLLAVLLLPDLRCVPLALLGLMSAMMMLEMLRMAVDIAAWGMSRATFLAYRIAVVIGLIAGGLAVGGVIVREAMHGGRLNVGEGILERFLEILVLSSASVLAYAALPFRPFVDLVVADRATAGNVLLAATAFGAVALLVFGITHWYAATVRRVAVRERRDYDAVITKAIGDDQYIRTKCSTESNAIARQALQRMPRWSGVGPLMWRQLVGARRSWGSLLTAMIAPAVLACAPCFVIADADIALLATAGTLAFYTFLLLPTAVRYDFRRDLDRMAMLKGLPISPAATVTGQTFTPVLIATLFQAAVLAFAVAARSQPPHYLFLLMLVMLPLNALVFSFDNLIFLLYPYRVQQEGVEIFVRTMLTFTGKGLLFTLGLGAMSLWGFVAALGTRQISNWTGMAIDPFAVFSAGMIAGPAALAALVLCALRRTYCRMDPMEDIPR